MTLLQGFWYKKLPKRSKDTLKYFCLAQSTQTSRQATKSGNPAFTRTHTGKVWGITLRPTYTSLFPLLDVTVSTNNSAMGIVTKTGVNYHDDSRNDNGDQDNDCHYRSDFSLPSVKVHLCERTI